MSIIERTIKLVLATCISILLAQMFHLQYATSAGIIAILSILDTRRSSIKMAGKRFASAWIALSIACLIYSLLGFSMMTLALYLSIYIPLSYYFKIESGIAPSTVLVLHLYLEQSTSFPWIVNELMLFTVGVSTALLFNLYMSSKDEEIELYMHQVEERLKEILLQFQQLLLQGDGRNEAERITELDTLLKKARDVVYLSHHNQLFHQTNYQVHYFEMRMEQNKILRQIASNMNNIHFESEENFILAQLFKRTADQLSRNNSAKSLCADIDVFLASFRQRSLPQTREAFEARAVLFQILHDLHRFIQLKIDFYETYATDK